VLSYTCLEELGSSREIRLGARNLAKLSHDARSWAKKKCDVLRDFGKQATRELANAEKKAT
jgi:hypothetical protein